MLKDGEWMEKRGQSQGKECKRSREDFEVGVSMAHQGWNIVNKRMEVPPILTQRKVERGQDGLMSYGTCQTLPPVSGCFPGSSGLPGSLRCEEGGRNVESRCG